MHVDKGVKIGYNKDEQGDVKNEITGTNDTNR